MEIPSNVIKFPGSFPEPNPDDPGGNLAELLVHSGVPADEALEMADVFLGPPPDSSGVNRILAGLGIPKSSDVIPLSKK